jgi:exopolysaccharide biosynthesis polyprenyl glycosylphosphotransferase
MLKDECKYRIQYILTDFLMANIAWLLFNIYRYQQNAYRDFADLMTYLTFPLEVVLQIAVPVFWLILYYYSGFYNHPLHRDRLHELRVTFTSVFLGCLTVFFMTIINDNPMLYSVYYDLLLTYFGIQFGLTFISRFALTQRLIHQVHRRKLGARTLIIGTGQKARRLGEELFESSRGIGHLYVGYVEIDDATCYVNREKIIGKWQDIDTIMEKYEVQEVMVALDAVSEKNIYTYINKIYPYRIPIKMITGPQQTISSSIRMTSLYTSPMIDMTRNNMPDSQRNIKQTIDIIVSIFALIILSPLFAYLAFRIRKDSEGPIFYRQKRVGYRGKCFWIYKFRTMIKDAEREGIPMLSSENDQRVTSFGRVMRKYRLDELPQFINILKGEMSLVGPRPERPYYVEQIKRVAPYHCLTYNVKPGLTSWATVKNGYANTLDLMIERLKYDMGYMESCSLATDVKIMFYTLRTIFTGKGI